MTAPREERMESASRTTDPTGPSQQETLRDVHVTVRRAREEDRAAVTALLQREDLEAVFEPAEFDVAEVSLPGGGPPSLVACARLKRFPDGTLELASVATAGEHRGSGLATLLVRTLLGNVDEPVYGLALAPGFFARLGFRRIAEPPAALRAKAAANCASKVFETMVWLPQAGSSEAAEVRRVYGALATEARVAETGEAASDAAKHGGAGGSGNDALALHIASRPMAVVACCVPRSESRVATSALRVVERSPSWSGRTYRTVSERDIPASFDLGLGTGDPVEAAALQPGETLVDLGSGPGFDVLLAARAVGPSGRAIGVDLTPEMIALARDHAASVGAENATFVAGALENVPLPDATADVVVSNCVFNLSNDKAAAFAEAFRILKPGGRFVVSDTLRLAGSRGPTEGPTCGCAGGALTKAAWSAHLSAAGFTDVDVAVLGSFGSEAGVGRAMIRARKV